jgi:outer membrane protein TolC
LITKAMQSSPELAELDAQIDSSRDREKVAGETDRQRLDLEGWLQTEGLGNREVPPALEQFGKFGAFSAHVGLVYELPLTGSRYASQQAAAHAGTEVIESRREALRQQIEADVTVLLDRLDVAGQRVALARRTAEVAEAEQKAANDRLELGDAIAIEVQRAEDALRQAKLRTARARVDWVQAKMALDHLTGELLRSYADQIPIAKPRDAGALAPRRRVALRHGPY